MSREIKSPKLLAEKVENGGIFRHCVVPEDLVYLEGHFPDVPIVPGVVQIDWVMQALTHVLGEGIKLLRLEAMKFTSILEPGVEFFIEIKPMEIHEKYQFRLWSEQTELSKGRIFIALS